MTPAGNRGAPLSAALALLAAITLSTAVWAGVAVPRTAAVVREAVTQEPVTTATAGGLLGRGRQHATSIPTSGQTLQMLHSIKRATVQEPSEPTR